MSQFLNCSDLPTVSQLKLVNLVSTIFSLLSLLVLLLLLALLVLYKAYHSTLQRLFLALTLVTVLSITVSSLSIELQFDIDPRFCNWIGFMNVWMGNLIEVFSLALTVYLTVVTYQQLQGNRKRCCTKFHRKSHKMALELLCYILLVLFPLSYIWVPIYNHNYGRDEAVCWIKTRETDCQRSNSKVTVVTIEAFDVALHLVVIIGFLALMVTFSVKIVRLKNSKELNIKKTTSLIVVIFVSTTTRIGQLLANLVTLIFDVKVDNFLYDIIDNPISTVSTVLVPLGFGVYLYSLDKLRMKSLKKAAKNWSCCARTRFREMKPRSGHIDDDKGLENIESSIERNVPSHTTYSSPYTNEFTDITEIVSSQECHRTVPKYGSIQDT